MYSEIKTFRFTCDKCKAVVVIHDSSPTLPRDWSNIKTTVTEKYNGWDTVRTVVLDICDLCLHLYLWDKSEEKSKE